MQLTKQEEYPFTAKTQEEYASKTACIANPPEIDFSTHYIIGGSVYVPRCAELQDQNLRLVGDKLVYQVHIDQLDCQALSMVHFMVTVPISYKDKEVDFQIEY